MKPNQNKATKGTLLMGESLVFAKLYNPNNDAFYPKMQQIFNAAQLAKMKH